ncbi:MAG: glycosyltransferase family 9 protein [Ardenticatenaceae bacterium]
MAIRDVVRSLVIQVAARRVAPKGGRVSSRPKSILLIRPDHLGDVLFLTPALRALRAAQPEAKITLLVGPWAKGLLTLNSDVDEVETLNFPWFNRKSKKGLFQPYKLLQEEAAGLKGRFDSAIICRFDHWWGAWLAAAAGIERIMGYNVPNVAPFLTEKVSYIPGQHEVVQNLTLTSLLGTPATTTPQELPLRYEVTGQHRFKARQLLNGSGLMRVDGPLAAIHPGSGALVKHWEVAQWGHLMDTLRQKHGFQFVITGGPSEILLGTKVVRSASEDTPVASLAGETSLPELAALYERCELVIGPDSGPLHIAAAMQRPTVHLYGPVNPRTFGPWGDPKKHLVVTQSLACQYCNRLDWKKEELPEHPCITKMPFHMVLGAAERLIGKATTNS